MCWTDASCFRLNHLAISHRREERKVILMMRARVVCTAYLTSFPLKPAPALCRIAWSLIRIHLFIACFSHGMES